MVIPFFEPAERHRALGVIEVVKNDKDVSFAQLLESVCASLESVSLCTSDVNVNQLEEGLKQWPADNDLHLFDFGFDLYPTTTTTPMHTSSLPNAAFSQPIQMGNADEGAKYTSLFNLCTTEAQDVLNAPHAFLGADAVGLQQPAALSNQVAGLDASLSRLTPSALPEHMTESEFHSLPNSLVDLGEKDVPGLIGMAQTNVGNMFQAVPPAGMPVAGDQVLDREKLEELLHTLSANKFRKKRRQKMGSGKHLTYQDLEKHFGVGLKQAAAALGICPTTLKRACRRNGIERWPSRQAFKSSGLDQRNASAAALPSELMETDAVLPGSTQVNSSSQILPDLNSPPPGDLEASTSHGIHEMESLGNTQ